MIHLRRRYRYPLIALVVLVIALIGARMYLPIWLTQYVNTQINSIKGYNGSVADIDVHLYRGAYTIHAIEINKTGSGVPVPFFKSETMDIAMEWRALFHGRVVAEIDLREPVINFAVNAAGTDMQTGENVDWTKEIMKITPFDINRVTLHDGKIFYRDFSTTPKVNIYLTDLSAEVTNLRNVVDKNEPLPSTLKANGKSIGGGSIHMSGRLNALKQTPDMDIALKLEQVSLPALNDYFRAFAFIDVEKGAFFLYSELKVKDGRVSGYVKPIAQNMSIISLEHTNPLKLAWESIVAVVVEVFTNQRKDQFATQIPLTGRIDNVETSGWETLIGILHNAFVQAYRKGIGTEA